MTRWLILVAALFTALPASAQGIYTNERFGVSAYVPEEWIADPPPANGDGRTFTSPDGFGRIAIYGAYAVLPFWDEANILMEPEGGETITYQRLTGDGVIVGGTVPEGAFLRRSFIACDGDIWANVDIRLPAGQTALTADVASSLAVECTDRERAE